MENIEKEDVKQDNESTKTSKKGNRFWLIGAGLIAVLSGIGGAFIDRFSQVVVDKFFPPEDQVGEIVRSIDDLNQNITENSNAITLVIQELAQKNADPDNQKLLSDLSTQVNSLVLTGQQLGQRSVNLATITEGIVSDSGLTKGANLWLPMGTSTFVGDDQNTFGIARLYDESDNRIRAALNGREETMSVGSKWEFESTSKGNCFVSYFGREGDAFAFGVNCNKGE